MHVSPVTVAQVAVGALLLPIVLGLAIGRWTPQIRQWIPTLQKVSSLLLLACFVGFAILAGPRIGELIREGTLTAIVIIALVGLAVGHVLGGPNEDDRTVLAFATVSRHPGVAMAVGSLTDQTLAPIGVLLAVLINEAATIPYKAWRKRLLAIPHVEVGGQPPTPSG